MAGIKGGIDDVCECRLTYRRLKFAYIAAGPSTTEGGRSAGRPREDVDERACPKGWTIHRELSEWGRRSSEETHAKR